jgi:hypothetical protein
VSIKPTALQNKYPVRLPVNALQNLIQEFLDGAPFTESLCDRVTSTYCLGEDNASYKRQLEFVKSIFNQSQHARIYPDVFVIQTSFELTDLQVALMVRMVNLSYHKEVVITLNGSIVYIPDPMRHYTEEEIRIHTHKRIQSVRPGKISTWLKRRAERRQQLRKEKIDASTSSLAAI